MITPVKRMDSRLLAQSLRVALQDDLREIISPDMLAQANTLGGSYLWPDSSVREVSCLTLLRSIDKKNIDSVEAAADARALDKFLGCNSRCLEWSLGSDLTSKQAELFSLLKNEMYLFFVRPNSDTPLLDNSYDICHRGRMGPGASVGAEGCSFFEKLFLNQLTATSPSLYVMYRRYVKNDPRWRLAEEYRRWYFGQLNVVEGSKLSFVPKTRTISRTICTEPSLNMFLQLGIGALIEKRLKERYSIDLSSQPDLNRDMSMQGSKDGSFCTIDLESASDSISNRMLAAIMPRQAKAWLDTVRSPAVWINGTLHQLNMVSTMGNGFTFPLQTAIFCCVVAAAHKFRGLALKRNETLLLPEGRKATRHGNFGVFGDDIICQPQVAGDVVELLTLLGFKINDDKSFFEGRFRESCGVDAFAGVNVRGVYIKTLSDDTARYVAFNRLLEWSAVNRIPLSKSLRVLFESVERGFLVPLHEQYDAGFRVPLDYARAFVQVNRRFQAYAYMRNVPDRKYRPLRDGFAVIGKKRYQIDSCSYLLGVLQGSITPQGVGLRQNVRHRKAKRAYSSSWDSMPAVGDQRVSPVTTEAWKASFYQSLG